MKDNNSEFIKTYSDLSDLMEYRTSQDAEKNAHVRKLNRIIDNAGSIRSAALALIGFEYLGIVIEKGCSEFRTNRYFLDSIKIQILPSIEQIRMAMQLFISSTDTNKNVADGLISIREYLKALESTHADQDKHKTYLKKGNSEPSESEFEFLTHNGFLVIEDAIPEELCDDLKDRLERLATREAQSTRGGYLYGSGKMQRVYQLLAKDEAFQNLLLLPVMNKVLRRLFERETYHDKYFLSSFHGNILKPNAEAQIWHVDANVPNPLPPWIIRANASFMITEHTEENGATEIVPGSHKLLRKPTKSEVNNHSFPTKRLVATKGSVIFWHGHVWHRSSENRSQENRPAVLATYAASFLREMCLEENHYLSLSENMASSLPKEIKRLLGWSHGAKHYS
jgi:hypothetical protein